MCIRDSAVTTDQVSDILTHSGKIYTCLKIDEVNNLGAARIRIRSLIAAIRTREKNPKERKIVPSSYQRAVFTEEMRKTYTILAPQMAPIHFELLEPAFKASGYNPVSYTHLDVYKRQIPHSSTNFLMEDGVNPLLLSAAMETRRGSSHPSTIPSSTNFLI